MSDRARYSGSWYNPDRNYEGFQFQVLDNGGFLIIFYTYPGPTDNALATQSFILGVGTLSGTTATITDAYRTRGPVIGEAYDKDDLQFHTWGDFTVEFLDENNARVEYVGADGSGTTLVTRLTHLVNPGETGSLPYGMSSTWYDPDTNGQGWFVEVISATQALVYWFTYDEHGNQAWSMGVGDINGHSIYVNLLSGKGTRFGDEFVSDDVYLEPMTSLTIGFENCNEGVVLTDSGDGTAALSYPVVRLTNLEGHECSPISPSPEPRAAGDRFFFVATSDSETEYFREEGISWEVDTQFIFRVNIDTGESTEVDSNHSPSWASSTIYSYTVDDRYFVREEYDTQHIIEEYDTQNLQKQWRIRLSEGVDNECSAITDDSYFYQVRIERDPFFGDTGGEFMRLDLAGNSTSGDGVQLDTWCYQNLDSSNGVLYDAIYIHDFWADTAGIGLYTRDPVTAEATTMAELFQQNAEQFNAHSYSFHFDGETVFIIRKFVTGAIQVLRYVPGIGSFTTPIYTSSTDVPEDFCRCYGSICDCYRDVDDGYVAIANSSGFVVLLDTINQTIEYFQIDGTIYDMAFLFVPD